MNLKKILIPATMVTFIFATSAFAVPSYESHKAVRNHKIIKVVQNHKHNESNDSKLNKLVRSKVITNDQKNKIIYAIRNNHRESLRSVLNKLVRSKVINKYQANRVYDVLN